MVRFFPLILLAAGVAGCPASKPEAPPTAAPSTHKIVIRGSNTFGEELAPRLIEAFKQEHPGAEFDVESKATVYGFAALLGSKCDIAAASRPPLKEELELARMRGLEMNDCVVGAYTVAVVLNAGNAVTNLTKDQVRDIFTGTIRNWKEVGGPDQAINVYIRDLLSGTYFGFKEMALGNTPYTTEARLLPDYVGIIRSVAADPQGVGFSGFDHIKDAGIKAVTINGIEPSITTVHAGNYPYSRIVRLHTTKTRESDATKEFIKFVQSERGKAIVAETGFTP